MNSCEYYQELISRLVDGEISREEHEALMAHLNTCSRCNAMYAVFHDLSDILSEEPEPLPEGLHENIMAGVRRSEIIKKNRRLRTFGLRMALSAAACALLVLFAASGFGSGKRAADVSLRTQEAAEQLYQAPQAATAESMPALTENVFTLSAQTAAPTPVWTAPAETPTAYASPDVRLAAGNSVNETYNTLQPEQYNPYQDDRYAAPVTMQTPVPAQYYEPFAAAQTPAPAAVAVQTPAPAVEQAPASVPEQFSAPAETDENQEAPLLRKTEPEFTASQDNAFASMGIDAPETSGETVLFAATESAPALLESKTAVPEAMGNETVLFFSEFDVEFASGQADDETDETTDTGDAVQLPMPVESAAPELYTADLTSDAAVPAPEENGEKIEELPAATPEKKAEEQSAKIYGKTGRDRLLALLGGSESELPTEAELTRVVHVTISPDDAYSSEEKMDINIYGDFVYYRLYSAEGAAKSCRAVCALRELDSLLRELTAPGTAAAEPTPTADPYAFEMEMA